jgi:hypothetical protein
MGVSSAVTWRAVLVAGALALCVLITIATADSLRVQSRLDYEVEDSAAIGQRREEINLLQRRDETHDAWRRRRAIYTGAGAIVLVLTGAGVILARGSDSAVTDPSKRRRSVSRTPSESS